MKINGKKFIAGILTLCMALLPFFPVYAESGAGLRMIEGKTYYFNQEGVLQTGWQTVDGLDYYFSPDSGERCESMEKVIDGIPYSFDSAGIASKVEQENNMKVGEENLPGSENLSENAKPEDVEQSLENERPTDGMEASESGSPADEEGSSENEQPANGEESSEDGHPVENDDLTKNEQPSEDKDNVEEEKTTENGNLAEESSEDEDFAKNPPVTVNNSKIKTGFQIINGKLYYFNDVGEMQYGWISIGDKKYFAAADGVVYRNQFISFGSTMYYMGSDGSVQKGVIKTSIGTFYNADKASGIIRKQAGWIEENGKRYFSDANGKLYQNQFISFGSTMYYMGSDGSIQKGFVKTVGGEIYNADKVSGMIKKQAGWLEENGKRYFSDPNGKLYQNQFISFGSTTMYYMGSDGSIQKGFVKTVGGEIYNADKVSGMIKKQAGWLEENGKRYFSDPNGKLYQNQFISFGSTTMYYMGSDGSIQKGFVKTVGGEIYNADKVSGMIKKQAGWLEENGKRYFSDASGRLYSNQFISFGSTYYYCGSDAAIIRGQKNYPAGGVLYSFDANGIMQKEGGWGEYNGNKYFKNPATGFPYKNQWVTFGSSVRYYADTSGFMAAGWRSVGGYRYYFYPDTKMLAMNAIADGIQVRSDGKVVGTASTNARINWLFPNGLPGTEAQMRPYLTTVTVPVVDANGNPSTVQLTIHKKLVHEITAVFNELNAIGFPVRKSDTAAYNWRNMAAGSSRSHHSYGCVVDLNWNSNPMIGVTAGSYRPGIDPYSVTPRVVQIWKNHGFYWGGDWRSTKDYMHFTYTNH